MKLWLLIPINGNEKPWIPWYDKAFGFVVRADTEFAARKIASEFSGDEGKTAWLSESLSQCAELHSEGQEGLIIREFAAG